MKTIKRQRHVTDLNDFDKNMLRRTVLEFNDRGENPTLSKLRKAMAEKIGFQESLSPFLRILKKLGFTYNRYNDGRRYLMQGQDIAEERAAILTRMHNTRSSGYTNPIFYLDETWEPLV
ncbi:hypothetical protein ANN_11133 [Periplaneta americana]|uniref:Uncharacterized protein n=1 Tax=Periplaneta americana TaxID=6978 RepID=A0ABQ8T464_PERAM|nr:hypothetical protein ANN_11133 [Periplaneta americana]